MWDADADYWSRFMAASKKRYFRYFLFVCSSRVEAERKSFSHSDGKKWELFSARSIWTLHFSAINFILNWLREFRRKWTGSKRERESCSALHSGHLIDFILIAHPSYQTAAETAAKRKLEREVLVYSAWEKSEPAAASLLLPPCACSGCWEGKKTRRAHTGRPRSCHSRATCPDVRSMSCFSAIHSRYSSWQPGRIQPNEIDTIKRRVCLRPRQTTCNSQ